MAQTIVTSPYADYQYYKDVYLGEAISEEEFPRLEKKAERYLDALCFHRIHEVEEKHMTEQLADLIRVTVCEMAEAYKSMSPEYNSMLAAAVSGISSENNDGYAVSYGGGKDAVTVDNEQKRVMKNVALMYLGDSGLMYRGGGDWYED